MARFLEALKVKLGLQAPSPPGDRFMLVGKAVTCPHCAHDRFLKGKAQLNTAGMTFLNLDWADRSATTLACAECGRIEWLLDDPVRID